MGVKRFNNGVERFDTLSATVNKFWKFHFILN